MSKVVLVTGSTDGIGLVTAKTLVKLGHTVLLHGRNEQKLAAVEKQLLSIAPQAQVETFTADLSVLEDVQMLVKKVLGSKHSVDVLINNAGVFKVPVTTTPAQLDVRFMVNTIAPYLLTRLLMNHLGANGRIVNVASAAQASYEPSALLGPSTLGDNQVYAQSKLALICWTQYLADCSQSHDPMMVAVNPASLLGSKMVKEAYGFEGGDLQKGADVLVKAALSHEFSSASGLYFDNDIGQFATPHPDAQNTDKQVQTYNALEQLIKPYTSHET